MFNLEHLATLSDAPELTLLVSEQTKYLLNNLILRDLQDNRRYATEVFESGYVPVRETHKDWLFYKAIVARAALELAEEDAMAGMIGFTESFFLESTEEVPSGTAINVSLDTVPAGEKWRVLLLQVSNDSRVPTRTILRFRPSGLVSVILDATNTIVGLEKLWEGDLGLSEDEYIQMRMYGVVAGDNVSIGGWFLK